MLKILRVLYLFLNAAIVIALLVIHFVYKENSYKSSLLYYAFPLPVIILAVLFLTIFLKRKLKKFNLIITAVLLIIWLSRSLKVHFAEDIKETDLEIVFWNASRSNGFETAFTLNKSIPDIMVVVEVDESNVEKLQLKFPDYYFYLSKKEVAIFSKTPISHIEEIKGVFSTFIINFKVNSINFYALDVTASLDVPKTWALELVNQHIKNKTNTIVLGDFNVPYESKHLEKIKTNFNHAFNEKGNGFRETWFWNIPLLSLDHIWVSKDLEILKTEKIGTFKSDHSMVKTYVRK